MKHPGGSVLIEVGDTKVICAASVEEGVPRFLRNKGRGWVTAEYSMLPGATHSRSRRESSSGKVGGRTHEIQRLIGRSLRSVTDLEKLGERTVWIDCDVIQADGGTRTASITGAYVALYEALKKLESLELIDEMPLIDSLAAVSVGIVEGEPCLDLCYDEDSRACVDMNFVMTGKNKFVEVQAAAESNLFSRSEMDIMTDLAIKGVIELTEIQNSVLL